MSDGPVRESDVFVSFCEEDDSPLGDADAGCISTLCDALQQLAGIDLDRELSIGRPGSDAPESAAILLVVLSSAYADALERTVEAKKFAKAAGGPEAAAERTVVVVLEATDVGGALGWLKDARTLDLFDGSGAVTKGQLNQVAGELAESIVATLSADPGHAGPSDDATVVFLAHTDAGASWARQHVRKELEDRGFAVVPRGPAQWDPDDPEAMARFSDELKSALEGAEVSVHVLGEQYHDAAALELGLAAGPSQEGELTRFVWIGPEGEPADARLQPLYDSAETAASGTVHFRGSSIESFTSEIVDVLEGRKTAAPPKPAAFGVSALRSALLAALQQAAPEAGVSFRGLSDESLESALDGLLGQLGEAGPAEAPDPDAEKYVYLLFDPSDQKRIDRVKRALLKRGFDVWVPLFSDDSTKNAQQHRQYLENCDASLVVYGEAPGEWWHALQVQWKKLRYWRKSDERLPRGFYLAAPFTGEKLDLRGSEKRRTVVIREQDRFSDDLVAPFFDLLERRPEPDAE